MSELLDLQKKFTLAKGQLIIFAYSIGCELTCGDAYRSPRVFGDFGDKKGYGSANSVHKLRLAQDFNLFVDGHLIKDSSHPMFKELHDYWEKIGGSRPIKGDANHFSFSYGGHR